MHITYVPKNRTNTMKILSRYLIVILAVFCFGCSAEMARDGSFNLSPNQNQNASGSLKGTNNDCLATAITGTFQTNTAQNGSNYVIANVNVTVPGMYSISTDVQNGVKFSASGVFASTGIQQVRLVPSGTFANAVATNYTLTYGSSSCPLAITVTEGTGTGTPGTDPGTGNPGTGNGASGSWTITVDGKTYTGTDATLTDRHLMNLAGFAGTNSQVMVVFVLKYGNGGILPATYTTSDDPMSQFSVTNLTTTNMDYLTTKTSVGALTNFAIKSITNGVAKITISGKTIDMATNKAVVISGEITAPLE
ncbi:hypothetical protein CLV59_104223 [Chitinophaga dinghuensis]|uniref:Uncharacterized protein n=2 Tax=Chitinophaga dinghuensis TaxID=1539050 RepID=A0A327W7J1_9BACT|nr:hypothetical protein CLV59_104223 [Chitinophaga dinghuensis]